MQGLVGDQADETAAYSNSSAVAPKDTRRPHEGSVNGVITLPPQA
jgi:hypothetical protein